MPFCRSASGYSPASVADRHPVLARITPGGETLGQSNDRLRSTERDRRLLDEHMSHCRECRAHGVADRRLERHPLPVVMAEARRVDGRLHIHTEHKVVEQELHVTLRLNATAHESEAHI